MWLLVGTVVVSQLALLMYVVGRHLPKMQDNFVDALERQELRHDANIEKLCIRMDSGLDRLASRLDHVGEVLKSCDRR